MLSLTAVVPHTQASSGIFLQDALSELRYLVAGAGGLGCELLKNFALMGVGSGDGGTISIADPDVVEIPNLPGQSLFRRKDLGKSKASVAAEAVTQINASVKIEAIQVRLFATMCAQVLLSCGLPVAVKQPNTCN
jgi:ubiquitin-activating enzyme E1